MLTAGERLQGNLTVTESGCWEYVKSRNPAGYGVAWDGKKTRLAHRLAWLLWTGEEPEVVRHSVCDNPPCCNPFHLRGGTHADNVGDKVSKGRHTRGPTHPNSGKTHCPQGHEYSSENTYVYPNEHGGVRRHCKSCLRNADTKRKRKK